MNSLHWVEKWNATIGRILSPPERLTVSQWAAKYRELTQGASIEPGRWRNERTPYLVEIMDSLSPDNGIERIVFQKSVQVGATETGVNFLAWIISHNPAPILMVLPTLDLARKVSRQRLAPMLQACEPLRDLNMVDVGPKSANNVLQKDFPGGTLLIAGSKSGAALRSMPIRYLFLDELDAYPEECSDEGSPIDIAIARTATFGKKKKIFMVSTPKLKHESNVEPLYQKSDMRKYHVPCPHCAHGQALEWKHLKFNVKAQRKTELATHYVCVECGGVIDESDKTEMLEKGRWVAERESDDPALRGYHINSLYSPTGWLSWDDLAWDWVEADREARGKKFAKLKAFIMTNLAETWDDSVEKVQWDELRARQLEEGEWKGVPAEVMAMSVGVDVQADRLEASVFGWNQDDEAFAIDHHIIHGSPDLDDVWAELDVYVAQRWLREDGKKQRAARVMVDCGYATNKVKMYAKKRKGVFAVMGQGGGKAKAAWWKGSGHINIAVNVVKDYLFENFKIDPPGPRSLHFPKKECFNDEYFKQLTAERRNRKGVWEAKRANEALDCLCYSFIGWQTFGINKVRLGPGGVEKVKAELQNRLDKSEV